MADHRDHTHSFLFITTSLMYSTEWQPLPLSITNIGGNTEDDCSLPPPIPEFDFQGLILSVLCFLFSNLEARMWDGSLISKTKQNKTIDIVPVKDERRSLETESGRIWVYQLPAHPIPPPPPPRAPNLLLQLQVSTDAEFQVGSACPQYTVQSLLPSQESSHPPKAATGFPARVVPRETAVEGPWTPRVD